jgi:hypothetical protein
MVDFMRNGTQKSGPPRGPLGAAGVIGLAGVAVAVAAVAAWMARPPVDRATVATPEPAAVAATPTPSAAPEPSEEAPPPIEAPGLDLPPVELPPGFSADTLKMPWGVVDLDAARDAMPDNLYWQMAAPTDDLRVQQERDEERDRWNVEYGKVLSGTGTEEEIQAYFAHRQRLSADYVQFVSYVLDHYAENLPEQDVGLLELARKLHLARLEEIPRKTQEAIDRKHQQDAAREAWQREEADFQSGDAE